VDAELTTQVQAARAGDGAAWDALLRRYQLPVFAYVHDLIRERQASLDIVQETFVNAVRHLASLRDDDKFGAWLFGIARQKCVHHWRKLGRDARVFDAASDPSDELPGRDGDTPVGWLIRQEQEEKFLAALDRLPAAHRETVMLHFLEEFPLEEVAAVTGAPVGTVKSRLHYAKSKLRELLEDQS
jgi:RNA polymerase sigma-70 factor (ECF subfamily)